MFELTCEQSASLRHEPPDAILFDGLREEELTLIPRSELSEYIQWLDSMDPEQIAWARMGAENLGRRLMEQE